MARQNLMPSKTCTLLLLLLLAVVLPATDAALAAGRFGKVAERKIARTSQNKDATTHTTKVKTFDLGQDKLVDLFVPPTGHAKSASSVALARLLVHCPSFVNDCNVMELGSGLGLVSASVSKHTDPKHVAVTDHDNGLLGKAYASCTQLCRPSASVSKCVMNWNDRTTWPAQLYDTIVASDILNDGTMLPSLVKVLKHYLLSPSNDNASDKHKRAIIVEPIDRVNRGAFLNMVRKAGMEADETPFPGMTDQFVLISIIV